MLYRCWPLRPARIFDIQCMLLLELTLVLVLLASIFEVELHAGGLATPGRTKLGQHGSFTAVEEATICRLRRRGWYAVVNANVAVTAAVVAPIVESEVTVAAAAIARCTNLSCCIVNGASTATATKTDTRGTTFAECTILGFYVINDGKLFLASANKTWECSRGPHWKCRWTSMG